MDDFYDLLEVPEDATQADIRRAWRAKAREYHPDVNDDDRANVQFKTLQEAYEVLSDETERAAYDRMGHATYVDQRLDGLPTAGMTRPNDASSGGTRWRTNAGSGGRSRASHTSNRSPSSGGASSRDASQSSHRSSASSRSSGSRTRGSGGRSASRGSSASSSRSSHGRSSNGSTSRGSSGDRSSTHRSSRRRSSGDASSSTRGDGTAGEAAESADAATRHPLWYGWAATFVAGVAYLGGLAAYLDANAGPMASFASAVSADPAAALLADHGLVAPGTFAVGAAAAAPGPALAFPAGAALLAVVFLAVVGKFGRGTAYLYLLGALAPLSSLAVGPVVALPAAGATLALVVLLPVLATTLFLADAGRFLAADA